MRSIFKRDGLEFKSIIYDYLTGSKWEIYFKSLTFERRCYIAAKSKKKGGGEVCEFVIGFSLKKIYKIILYFYKHISS